MTFKGRPTESESYLLKRQRLRIARQVIAEGGNITVFAKRIGISPPGAIYYLRRNSPDTLKALKDGTRKDVLHPHTVLDRLRVISRSKNYRQAGERLGISNSGVCLFLKAYAPDGVEEALAEYEETYGAPLFEEAA